MDKKSLQKLLNEVRSKKRSVDSALLRLKDLPYEDLGFAKVDHHRDLRQGFPEVVLCQGKTIERIKLILKKLALKSPTLLATRADDKVYRALKSMKSLKKVTYYKEARLILIGRPKPLQGQGKILVVCAGTADIPVAEEAAVTAEVMGNQVERLYDVGVAGLHRLLAQNHKLYSARVLVVIAGMEGALPSVVAGLVSRPIIAVPTSIGYGANFKGLSALLTMINSCSPNVSVVNVDNGFGAGYMASLINKAD